MGNFRPLLLVLLALGACSPPPPVVAPSVVAPVPVTYTCPQLARMSGEFKALPSGSMIAQAMDDYRVERKALRALHGLPEQTCPPATP